MKILKSLGSLGLGVGILLASLFSVALLIDGGAVIAEKFAPLLTHVISISFVICLFVFLPLAFIKKSRIISVYGFLIASYIFGLSTWVIGFLVTYDFWGGTGVFMGLVLAGVGVVLLGLIASLLNGAWWAAANIIIGILLTLGTRILFAYLSGKVEDENEHSDEELANESNEAKRTAWHLNKYLTGIR